MVLTAIFIVSGLAIILLLVVKKLGERRIKQFFILRAISKGDKRVREVYHKTVSLYTHDKERFLLFLKKRIPMHSKNSLNKSLSFLKGKKDRYVERLRNSKIIGKSDGISEFFRSMSDVEKGNGEIHDHIHNGSQEEKELN